MTRIHPVVVDRDRGVGGSHVRLEDLLVEVGRGDAAAFEAVYDRICGPVYGIVRRVLRDRAQSEEVGQEILLLVWRSASRYDEARGSGLSWVMTIAHRRAVDRVRSEQSMTAKNLRYAAIEDGRSFDCVAEDVQTRDDRQAVVRCLAALSDLQRESVRLAYYGGHTHREVARMLAIPLGTVKTRIRDGLLRLRRCLDSGHTLGAGPE